MEKRHKDFLEVTIHQFKNNISRYMRALEEEKYLAIILLRKDERVGFIQGYRALCERSDTRKNNPYGPDGPCGPTEV